MQQPKWTDVGGDNVINPPTPSTGVDTQADDSDPNTDSASIEILDGCPIHPLNQGWPTNTHLVYPASGARITLGPQNSTIQRVVKAAIQNVLISLTFEDAFPTIDHKVKYNRDALYKAAKSLRLDNIATRIKRDKDYVAALAGLVC